MTKPYWFIIEKEGKQNLVVDVDSLMEATSEEVGPAHTYYGVVTINILRRMGIMVEKRNATR